MLHTFQDIGVRPTSDRVKESLFQILSPRLYHARVLDLFCGSGALGLESLSRGAREAVFCDHSKESVALLKKNLTSLKEEGEIYACDFASCLKRVGGQFDLIFADPPYQEDHLKQILALVSERNLLTEGGLVVYESERAQEGIEGFCLSDERSYGRARVCMWRRE